MKLTKGKISKLYSKKKQSLKKKVNKKRGSTRNKTFRKKRNIHLARKSLKRFHYKKQRGGVKEGEGEGEGDENISQESMPKVDEVSNSVPENLNQPTSETVYQSNIENADPLVNTSMEPENTDPLINTSMEAENAEPLVNTSMEPENAEPVNTSMEAENAEPVVNTSMEAENTEPLVNTSMEPENAEPVNTSMEPENAEPVNTSMEPENAEPVNTSMEAENAEPLVNTSMEAEIAEPLVNTSMEAENEDDEIPLSIKTLPITEPSDESNMEETDSTSMVTDNVEKPTDFTSSSLEQEPTEDLTTIKSDTVPSKKELMNSLSNVVDYITDAVAEKVSQKIPTQPNDGQQDGFDSVNAAAEMMAKNGGKRRKTRKFKLTKKNKTKRL